MSNETIKYEVKLQPSVIVILGLLAVGVCANAFAIAAGLALLTQNFDLFPQLARFYIQQG